jgi:hypothetical protein
LSSGSGGGSAGGSAAGGSAVGGGSAGGSGNSATLSGPRAFNVGFTTASAYYTDAGQPYLLTLALVDHATGTCLPSFTPPATAVQLTVQTTDGGSLALGTHSLGGLNYGKWQLINPVGQDTAYFSGGTVTITRGDTRFVGSFSTTLLHSDGGTSALSGTWDSTVCPL